MTVVDPRALSLRRALKAEGRKLSWLALQTGYSPSYVSNVLSGRQPWTTEFQEKAIKVLGVVAEVRETYRGQTIRVPANVYQKAAELDPEIVAGTYEDAWKRAWVRENGDTALAVAAERAWRQAQAAE